MAASNGSSNDARGTHPARIRRGSPSLPELGVAESGTGGVGGSGGTLKLRMRSGRIIWMVGLTTTRRSFIVIILYARLCVWYFPCVAVPKLTFVWTWM